MTKEEAQHLAQEIYRTPGWVFAFAEIGFAPKWWVRARHEAMRVTALSPFPTVPITCREDWEEMRAKWIMSDDNAEVGILTPRLCPD